MQRILSAATVAAIGLTCKAYLHSGLCSISVRGLPYLLEALNSPERQNGQGVVTGERCNFAEPTTAEYYFAPKKYLTTSRRALSVGCCYCQKAQIHSSSQARRPSHMGHSSRADLPTLALDALDPRRITNHIH